MCFWPTGRANGEPFRTDSSGSAAQCRRAVAAQGGHAPYRLFRICLGQCRSHRPASGRQPVRAGRDLCLRGQRPGVVAGAVARGGESRLPDAERGLHRQRRGRLLPVPGKPFHDAYHRHPHYHRRGLSGQPQLGVLIPIKIAQMKRKTQLTIELLTKEASKFAAAESSHDEPDLYGVTDGKAVGTYLEHKFMNHLKRSYAFEVGNSASGVDFPGLHVDMKVTSIRQPQSSCPFKSARQKIFGLGYNLLVFVYEKTDNRKKQTGRLKIQHTIFVDASRTADFQMTKGILQILRNDGNEDDFVAFLQEKNLPVDDIEARKIAHEILKKRLVVQGYLTISNALQWRVQH